MNKNFTHGSWNLRLKGSLALFQPAAGFAPQEVGDGISPEDICELLNRICKGKDGRDEEAGEQPAPQALKEEQARDLDDAADYVLLRLNAGTKASEFVSTDAGGILYEDPFWAVAAAASIARREKFCLPLADSNRSLWKRSAEASAALAAKTYRANKFLGAIENFLDDGKPVFSVVTLKGKVISALRQRGLASTFHDGSLTLFELYVPEKE